MSGWGWLSCAAQRGTYLLEANCSVPSSPQAQADPLGVPRVFTAPIKGPCVGERRDGVVRGLLLAPIPSLSVVVRTKHQPRPRQCQDPRASRSNLDQESQVHQVRDPRALKSGFQTKIQSPVVQQQYPLLSTVLPPKLELF